MLANNPDQKLPESLKNKPMSLAICLIGGAIIALVIALLV